MAGGKSLRAGRRKVSAGSIFNGDALSAATRAVVESLERRALLAAAPVITEFVASNANGLTDGNGVNADWIEIQNQGDAPIDLAGWRLTDNPAQPAKWTFPSLNLAAGAYTIVIADSSSSTVPDSKGYLHANFSLSADGENLSLRRPDGTVASEFNAAGTAYPKQAADVSYGTATVAGPTSNLIVAGAPAKATVATNGTIDGQAWTSPTFNDSAWKSGTTGVGYDGGGVASTAGLLARWYAPSLNLANNASVSSWNATAGTGTAVGASGTRPNYVTNQINGRAVVRFNGIDDQLRVTNQSLNGLANFTVAVVFRTSTAGGTGPQWYNNSGIVDAETNGSVNDWGVAINNAGAIGAGVGNPDTTLYSAAGLNNGQAHVAVFTKTGTVTALSIDGGAPIYGTAPAAARNINQLVFGSLNTNNNFFNGDLGEVRLYNTALSDDAVRSLAGEVATTWGITTAAGVYTPSIGLDLKTEMAGVATSAYVRVPFTVADASQINSLLLKMKYDDGFVAYLNGTEVARRNTPGGAITYASAATAARPDAAALVAETIDISAFTNLLQGNGATNVLAVRALNVSATDSDLLIVPELVAASSITGPAFMTTPTPSAANANGYAGFVSPVTASVPRGFYTASFATTLTSPTPGATIVYTTDGSTPTLTNGTKVIAASATVAPTATLNIAATTVLRTAAFRDGYVASTVSAVSYVFVADVVQQPEYTPAGAYWDVGMDTDVVNATQTWTVQQALTAVPTVSLTIDNTAMFGGASGIYTNPLEKGDEWERPVSVEYFDPNDPNNQFFINAGIRIQGSVSRQTSRPKKGFKLYFSSKYGESKLNFPVFGSDNPQTALDHLSLRAGHNYAWGNLGDTPYARAEYLRDQFARDTQLALTGKASRGSFVHVYINGQYWGMYNAAEDVDPDWAAANYGGDADDYDVIKPDDIGGIEADDGNLVAWNELFRVADKAYEAAGINDTEYAAISQLVDVKGLADYMLNVFYRGDRDAPVLIGNLYSPRNFIALHNRADPAGKIQFQTWDGEFAMDDVAFDRTEVYGTQSPSRLYQQLRSNAKFRQLMADEIQRAFGNNGPLSVAAATARYRALMAEVDQAIVGESARWGNAKQAAVGMRDTTWLAETSWITNTYIPQRSNVVLNQLKNDIPELSMTGPNVYVNGVPTTGGLVAAGAMVQIADPNAPLGTIYYTLDGTDPRTAAGTLSGTAVAYTNAITLPGSRTLQTRVLRGGVWSPLTSVAFTVPAPSLRLSEMMYHPATPVAGGPFAKDDYEYLELVNTGTTPIDLGGMTLNAGVFGTIAAGTTLAPGARGYLTKNAAAFQYAYGTGKQILLASYTDNLSNGGEQVRLYDPGSGANVFDFVYVDSWQPSTDGNGFALNVKDLAPSQATAGVLGVAAAWQASATAGGSPGTFNTAATKVSSVVIDDGSTQRTHVRGITVTFSRPVTAAAIAGGAFFIEQLNGTITPVTINVSGVTAVGGGSAVTLTFTQAGNAGPSLIDGRYRLVIDGSKIRDTANAVLDAAGTGVRGSSRTETFHRLAGDTDGNGGVDFSDFLAVQTAFGRQTGQAGYNLGADLDNNGRVDFDDFLGLQSRFGVVV